MPGCKLAMLPTIDQRVFNPKPDSGSVRKVMGLGARSTKASESPGTAKKRTSLYRLDWRRPVARRPR
jgi:hypothetical protein